MVEVTVGEAELSLGALLGSAFVGGGTRSFSADGVFGGSRQAGGGNSGEAFVTNGISVVLQTVLSVGAGEGSAGEGSVSLFASDTIGGGGSAVGKGGSEAQVSRETRLSRREAEVTRVADRGGTTGKGTGGNSAGTGPVLLCAGGEGGSNTVVGAQIVGGETGYGGSLTKAELSIVALDGTSTAGERTGGCRAGGGSLTVISGTSDKTGAETGVSSEGVGSCRGEAELVVHAVDISAGELSNCGVTSGGGTDGALAASGGGGHAHVTVSAGVGGGDAVRSGGAVAASADHLTVGFGTSGGSVFLDAVFGGGTETDIGGESRFERGEAEFTISTDGRSTSEFSGGSIACDETGLRFALVDGGNTDIDGVGGLGLSEAELSVIAVHGGSAHDLSVALGARG